MANSASVSGFAVSSARFPMGLRVAVIATIVTVLVGCADSELQPAETAPPVNALAECPGAYPDGPEGTWSGSTFTPRSKPWLPADGEGDGLADMHEIKARVQSSLTKDSTAVDAVTFLERQGFQISMEEDAVRGFLTEENPDGKIAPRTITVFFMLGENESLRCFEIGEHVVF